jgi:phosphoribosylaminoimidazole carboxylase PurE protein
MSDTAAPAVLILMGSINDFEQVEGADKELRELGIACELHVASAHRTPEHVAQLAREARGRGVKVIIAAAGRAAHLAGAVAANTTLPVIGIPIGGGPLGGLDALLSTVQMPSGIPVATVAIDGARNAALLAAEIIGVSDGAVAAKLEAFRAGLAKICDPATPLDIEAMRSKKR